MRVAASRATSRPAAAAQNQPGGWVIACGKRPGRNVPATNSARTTTFASRASTAATCIRTRPLYPDCALEERLAVDDLAAGQPRERREPPDLDVRGLRVVGRMLVAVLVQPRAQVVLVGGLPAAAAVHEQLVLSHRRRCTARE